MNRLGGFCGAGQVGRIEVCVPLHECLLRGRQIPAPDLAQAVREEAERPLRERRGSSG